MVGATRTVAAQGQPAQQLPAPPPMKAIPEHEQNQINEAKDPKARIRRIIDLAELHLQHAEGLASQQKYDPALAELGGYLALVEEGLAFLATLNNDRGKIRDLYKHLELSLRAQGPRLTVMRRATPLEYAMRMKEVEDFAREGRTEALNSFYGHTVVREGRQKKPDEDNKPKDKQPEREP
jgi:hypothetical protein